MQSSKFISLIKNPQQLGSSDLKKLEEIKEKHPWFAASHILLSKAHKNENRFSYQSLLKKAALYSQQREVLYEFINREDNKSEKIATDYSTSVVESKTIHTKEQDNSESQSTKTTYASKLDVDEPAVKTKNKLAQEPDDKQKKETKSKNTDQDKSKVDRIKTFEKNLEELETKSKSKDKDDNKKSKATISGSESKEKEVVSKVKEVIKEKESPAKADVQTKKEESKDERSQSEIKTIKETESDLKDSKANNSDKHIQETSTTSKNNQEDAVENNESDDEGLVYDPIKELQKFIEEDDEDLSYHEIVPAKIYDPEKELLKIIEEKELQSKNEKSNLEEIEIPNSKEHIKADSEKDEREEKLVINSGFLSWLDDISDTESESELKEEIEQDNNQILEVNSKNEPSKELELDLGEEKKWDSKSDSNFEKPDPQNLLDQFIKNRPSIRRMKKDFFNPQDMANKSLERKRGLVSETLANLHLKQGQLQEALEIYEQLKLQNPNKSTYFAARIKEIQNQIEKEND